MFVDPQASVFVRAENATAPQLDPSGRWGEARALRAAGGLRPAGLRSSATGSRCCSTYLRSLTDLGQLEPIEAIATRALERLPGDADVLAFRGFARLRRDRPLEAREDYAAVVRARPRRS